MKKPATEYFIHIKNNDTKEETLEPIKSKIYPFEHQGILLFTFKDDNSWNVSEKSTGLRITYGSTKAEAKQQAINIINKEGVNTVKEQIKLALKKMNFEKNPEENTWEQSLL